MASQKIVGVVTSAKQDKTIVITQVTRETHPLYGKKYTKHRKFAAHDEKKLANQGDTVEIIETKPISKNKRYVLNRIIETGHESVEIQKAEVEAEIEAKVEARKAKAEEKKTTEAVEEKVEG